MRSLSLALALAAGLAAADTAPPQTLIPRELLMGDPERANPQISPDGRRLAWLAPDANNVLQVWVKGLAQKDAEAVAFTHDKKRPIRIYGWTPDSQSLLYLQDADGDENFHLYGVELTTKNVRDFTPFEGVRAQFPFIVPRINDSVLVALNLRDRKFFDIYKLSLKTGALELDTQNTGDVKRYLFDSNLTVKGAVASTPEGGTELRVRDVPKGPWRSLIKVGLEENVDLIGFSLDGRSAFVTTSIDADTDRVVLKSLKTGVERALANSTRSDLLDLLWQPNQFNLQAAAFDVDGHKKWQSVDGVKSDFEFLEKLAPGDVSVISRDNSDQMWVVGYDDGTGAKYWLYDRRGHRGAPLFSSRPKLDAYTLSAPKPVSFTARDGTPLNGYLTTPMGQSGAGPMVLLVHGGPWARDQFGFSGLVQLLANRGYSVLQVEFRGSAGYGKRFLNLGNRQWGKTMQDDLTDSVQWAVQQNVADPKKVAIMGTSYGGYATLAGAAFTPELFQAGVDLCGPSNLFTLLATIPPYWATMRASFNKRMGNPDDAADKQLLTEESPLFSVEKIRIPLLIGQGANDPRVKPAEAEQVVAALEKQGLKATYVVYSDEGHGLSRPENRTDFYARAEAFLAQTLGGKFEPLPKDGKVPGSSAHLKVVGKAPDSAKTGARR
jgi:dipeptidyl aminopeptidase/acylaminoacyl peptidase